MKYLITTKPGFIVAGSDFLSLAILASATFPPHWGVTVIHRDEWEGYPVPASPELQGASVSGLLADISRMESALLDPVPATAHQAGE